MHSFVRCPSLPACGAFGLIWMPCVERAPAGFVPLALCLLGFWFSLCMVCGLMLARRSGPLFLRLLSPPQKHVDGGAGFGTGAGEDVGDDVGESPAQRHGW